MEPMIQHVSRTAGVCGGRPCIAGTRIRVQDIYVWHEHEGRSPDEIVSQFPQISLADVYAALAYYWDHREEIQREMQVGDELAAEMQHQFPSKLPPVRNFRERSGDGDSISSR